MRYSTRSLEGMMPTARENLYEMATVAFKETGVPPAVHAAVTLMLDLHERDIAVRLAHRIRTHKGALNGAAWPEVAAALIDPSEPL
ncbi:hypothetical protein ACIA6C_28295 [Streptomyces sp. NPDC051578]|uniref:hypothetical protein n=1 Tax=Streptomyces sp. NPDC051578 TaxID=3365662 RepID=UPI00378F7701